MIIVSIVSTIYKLYTCHLFWFRQMFSDFIMNFLPSGVVWNILHSFSTDSSIRIHYNWIPERLNSIARMNMCTHRFSLRLRIECLSHIFSSWYGGRCDIVSVWVKNAKAWKRKWSVITKCSKKNSQIFLEVKKGCTISVLLRICSMILAFPMVM